LAACGLTGAGGDYYGWTWCAVDGTVTATMAAQVDSGACTEACALVTKTLPGRTYLRVTHRGPARDTGLTLDYAYHTWLPQSDYRPALPWYVEHYGEAMGCSDAENGEWNVYIPVERVEV